MELGAPAPILRLFDIDWPGLAVQLMTWGYDEKRITDPSGNRLVFFAPI